MFRSKKLTDAARYFPCVLCGAAAPSVPAHANSHIYGKGAGLKAHDCYVSYVCNYHHSLIDGRIGRLTYAEQQEMFLDAWRKTVLLWFESGLVSVKAKP